ncbi:uncharacterized protein LOC111695255 [Eurytemora carolleeae]|uniref:uncharacterized protein LOC111695255 n=1 Tax=Eurytemora carolleeae TaxID=1294199 RepID=UPI000C76B97C|nr:uncharacterized protein LOC111695255 [Eurytemora carolleeae]|eukprot:XP_023320261.1 uncharacterized protein LOC111695255 [Eurytemora affinis]
MLKLRFGLILLLSFYLSTSLAQLEIDLACPQPAHRSSLPTGKPYAVHCTLAQLEIDLACPQELALLPQLENKSFMNAQIACMLDEGPCDPIGKKAKRIGADVLSGHCVGPCDKCTKQAIRKIISKMQNNYPKAWNRIQQKLISERRPGK